MSVRGGHDGGAAKRRCDRRLRMHWRHEQLVLQMALAAALHHSRDVGPVTYNALRSQKTARGEATNNALRSWKNSLAGDTEFFSLFGAELSGKRPEAFAEHRLQDRVMLHGDHGSAWRGRQRRLRSWWRHEQQSVAMALSAAVLHSCDKVAAEEKYYGLRGQNTDKAEAAHHAPRRVATSAARGPELFQLFEEELSGARPPPLVEVRPQRRVQRHIVERIVDVLPMCLCDGEPTGDFALAPR